MEPGQEAAGLGLYAGRSACHERHVHVLYEIRFVFLPDVHRAWRGAQPSTVAVAPIRVAGPLRGGPHRAGLAICEFQVGGMSNQEESSMMHGNAPSGSQHEVTGAAQDSHPPPGNASLIHRAWRTMARKVRSLQSHPATAVARPSDVCPINERKASGVAGGPPIRETVKRFVRFGLVGASGVVVDMGVLFLLADARMLGWDLSISKALAAETAIVNNFIWNDLWTFRDLAAGGRGWSAVAARLGKFNLICLVGVVLSILLLNAQVHLLKMNIYAANLITI